MWEAVGKLIDEDKTGLDEVDMKFVVERRLRGWLKSSEVRCEKVEGGKVVVQVMSPALRQEVMLRESELRVELEQKHGYRMIRLLVRV